MNRTVRNTSLQFLIKAACLLGVGYYLAMTMGCARVTPGTVGPGVPVAKKNPNGTTLHLREPTGAVMTLDGQSHTFPTQVTLKQKSGAVADHSEKKAYAVRLTLPGGQHARGFLWIYYNSYRNPGNIVKYNVSIDSPDANELARGGSVQINGVDPDQNPVYELLLGPEE